MKRFLNNYVGLFEKRSFRLLLISIWAILTAFFGYFAFQLKPDFEFEKFFPIDDPDITFYEKHLEHFDYDNDYILIILENKKSVFDAAFLQQVKDLTNDIRSIEHVQTIISPLSFKHMVSGPMGVIPFPLLHISNPDQLPKDSIRIVNHPVYSTFFSKQYPSILLQLQHEHLPNPEDATQLTSSLRGKLDETGISYRLVGKVVAQQSFVSLIQSDFSLFLGIALMLSLSLLIIIFRSIKMALLPYLISVTSLIWLLGIMHLSGHAITILGALIPPVILFVSSSDAIHLINGLNGQNALTKIQKFQKAYDKVFVPTLLTSITTAIGFFSLISINTAPIQSFGAFTALGVLIAFFITFCFGPLLLKEKKDNAQVQGHWIKVYTIWLFRHSKWIYAVTLLLIVAAGWGISNLQVNAYLLDDLPKDNEVRQNFEFVDQHYGGSKPWEMAIWPANNQASIWDQNVMEEVNKIHETLKRDFEMERLWSPVTYLKYGNQMNNGGLTESFRFPNDTDYPKAKGSVQKLTKQNTLPNLISQDQNYGRITGFIPEIGSAKTNQKNDQLINRLDTTIDQSVLRYRLTGTTYLIDKSHELLSGNLFRGLLIAVGIISLILGLYFRSIKLLVISIIPNIIPLLITGGYMGIADISLKLTTAIIFAVVFGIAVDDTIHFTAVYKRSRLSNPVYRSIYAFRTAGRAILITTIVVIAGFIIFTFSSFGATYFLGLFLSLGLAAAFVIDVTLLPLLLTYISQNKK